MCFRRRAVYEAYKTLSHQVCVLVCLQHNLAGVCLCGQKTWLYISECVYTAVVFVCVRVCYDRGRVCGTKVFCYVGVYNSVQCFLGFFL